MANSDSMLINIDGKKLAVLLRSYCAEENTNIYDLSRAAGYSQSWLYDICKSGRIRKAGIDFLKKNCGIDYSEYLSKDGKGVRDEKKYSYKKKHDVIDIDGKKLESLLDEYFKTHGGNIYELSLEFGFSRKWLYDAIVTNRLRKVGINLIKYKCNIDLEDYLPKPEPIVEEQPAETEESKKDISDEDKLALEKLNEFLSKIDKIVDALDRLADIQQKNSESLEELKNMLK